MAIIHCTGHQFGEAKDKMDRVLGFGWICKLCGLKVRNANAAKYLSGKPS